VADLDAGGERRPVGPQPGPDRTPGEKNGAKAALGRRVHSAKDAAARSFEAHKDVPVVDAALRMYHRDQEAAGALTGSAVAFRLFLFFVPMLLFVVGVAGFLAGFVSAEDVNKAAGLSGGLTKEIRAAFAQNGTTRWVALSVGFVGMLTAGRSLSRGLYAASAVAWRLPVARGASLRVVGALFGLLCGMALVAVLVSRLKEDFGLAVASASFLPALIFYVLAWLGISMLLPRGTADPGALLPGAVLVGLTLAVMHAVSELYLPSNLDRASQLYGALGATIVTLGWFFIIGRAIAIAMELNAVIYERFGSISASVFSLPVLRILPRRSAHIRSFFDLP